MTTALLDAPTDGRPDLGVQILAGVGAFTLDTSKLDGPDHLGWDDSIDWVDVRCDVTEARWQAGATRVQGALTKYEAGTLTVEMIDRDGRYDPLTSTVLQPGMPVRLVASQPDALVNGNFEAPGGAGSVPTGWYASDFYTTPYGLDLTGGYAGSQALKVGPGAAGATLRHVGNQTVHSETGAVWSLSCRVRGLLPLTHSWSWSTGTGTVTPTATGVIVTPDARGSASNYTCRARTDATLAVGTTFRARCRARLVSGTPNGILQMMVGTAAQAPPTGRVVVDIPTSGAWVNVDGTALIPTGASGDNAKGIVYAVTGGTAQVTVEVADLVVTDETTASSQRVELYALFSNDPGQLWMLGSATKVRVGLVNPVGGGWVSIGGTVTAPAAAYARLMLVFTTAAGGTLWVDDATMSTPASGWSQTMWTGQVDAVDATWPKTGPSQVTVQASDLVRYLTLYTQPAVATPVGLGDNLPGRVQRWLATAGLPTTLAAGSDISGTASLQATDLAGTAWDGMNAAVDAELGRVWVTGDNLLNVKARGSGYDGPIRGGLSDIHAPGSPTHCCYTDTVVTIGAELLTNRAIANYAGATGAPVQVDDLASQSRYRSVQSYERTDLPLRDTTACQQWATFLVSNQATAEVRVDSVRPVPQGNHPAWQAVCATGIGDRWQLHYEPSAGNLIDRAVAVLGVQHEVTRDRWDITWTTTMQGVTGGGWFTIASSALDGPDLLKPGS